MTGSARDSGSDGAVDNADALAAGVQKIDAYRILQSELATLREEWGKTREGRGGIVALTGFHYQMLTALVAVVRAWADKPDAEQNDPDLTSMFVEAVSDWTAVTETAIVACQVKRTRSSGSVHKALEEFWQIENLAKQCALGIVDRLCYRILSQEIELRDVEGSIARWQPKKEFDESSLESFKQKVETSLEPDPEAELLAFLANRFHAADPIGVIDGWLGELFGGATAPTGFDAALRRVWNGLQTLKAGYPDLPSVGQLWAATDTIPDSTVFDDQGRVLTGQQPGVEHLRMGYFADRKITYDRLADTVETWMLARSDQGEHHSKLAFFWIGGRSGSGKSVALLHVLDRLYRRGYGPIIWLGSAVNLLPEAVRWAKPLLRQGRQVLIAVDDPYKPNNQDETKTVLDGVESELLTMHADAKRHAEPMILCCGPTEQRLRFKKEFANQVPPQPVDATQALNLSVGVSNPNVLRGRSFS